MGRGMGRGMGRCPRITRVYLIPLYFPGTVGNTSYENMFQTSQHASFRKIHEKLEYHESAAVAYNRVGHVACDVMNHALRIVNVKPEVGTLSFIIS